MSEVYILGAGTSVCLGAPVLKNFRTAAERAHDGSLSEKTTASMGFGLALRAWDELGASANVEDLYTLAVLQGRLGVEGRGRLADDVAYMIAKTLVRSMRLDDLSFHSKLVSRVSDKDTIISLNWDIALDLAARRERRPLALGYERSRELDGPSEFHGWPVNLLKLHGSQNWLWCDECRTLWQSTSARSSLAHWENWNTTRCSECKSERGLRPLLLPPSSEKLSGESDVRYAVADIWRAARAALKSARSVTIVGYSFPRTDVQFRMFVLDALAANESLETLEVITETKYGRDRVDSEEHYAQIFRGSRHYGKIGFHYSGFEGWILNR